MELVLARSAGLLSLSVILKEPTYPVEGKLCVSAARFRVDSRRHDTALAPNATGLASRIVARSTRVLENRSDAPRAAEAGACCPLLQKLAEGYDVRITTRGGVMRQLTHHRSATVAGQNVSCSMAIWEAAEALRLRLFTLGRPVVAQEPRVLRKSGDDPHAPRRAAPDGLGTEAAPDGLVGTEARPSSERERLKLYVVGKRNTNSAAFLLPRAFSLRCWCRGC